MAWPVGPRAETAVAAVPNCQPKICVAGAEAVDTTEKETTQICYRLAAGMSARNPMAPEMMQGLLPWLAIVARKNESNSVNEVGSLESGHGFSGGLHRGVVLQDADGLHTGRMAALDVGCPVSDHPRIGKGDLEVQSCLFEEIWRRLAAIAISRMAWDNPLGMVEAIEEFREFYAGLVQRF